MPEGAFDRLARDLEGLQGRRSSLKVLGAAALAAALAPAAAEGKNKCKKKVDNAVATCQAEAQTASNARCQSQVVGMHDRPSTVCDGTAMCGALVACCPSLGTCDAKTFFNCIRGPRQQSGSSRRKKGLTY